MGTVAGRGGEEDAHIDRYVELYIGCGDENLGCGECFTVLGLASSLASGRNPGPNKRSLSGAPHQLGTG